MAERSTCRRSGFTLVEMLVVIAIIAILAAILIPVGAVVIGNGKKASNGLEIADVQQAIQKYVSDNGGQYPPSFGEGQANNTYYQTQYSGGTWRGTLLGRYVMKAYPKCSQRDIQYLFTQVADNMDQSTALYFWLNQTSADTRYPFTNAQKRSYLAFEERRLEPGALIPANAGVTPPVPALQLYGYHPRYAGQSLYVYIESRHYPRHVNADLSTSQSGTPAAGWGPVAQRTPETSVRPWLRRLVNGANPNTNSMDLQNYVNPDTYQLHMAGLDGRFSVSHDWLRKFPCGTAGLKFDGSQQDPIEFTDDRDNQTNFSDGKAIADIPAQE